VVILDYKFEPNASGAQGAQVLGDDTIAAGEAGKPGEADRGEDYMG
jgi:hypothetical protein